MTFDKSNALIIFDCDGVLIDSEIIAARLEAQIANSWGHSISPQEICFRFAGVPTKIVWETLANEIGHQIDENFFDEYRALAKAVFAKELKAINGASDIISGLKLPFCVASTTKKSELEINLQTTNLHDFFGNNIFSASQVKRPKPNPDVFLFAASQMGHDPKDCIVIEDSIAGVKAAQRAGMKVFAFGGASHIGEKNKELILGHGAIDYFTNYFELPILLKRHFDLDI
ncbi:MAG: HAD family hydrolase [Caulobacterales bacterium]|nr:HAD family hydrolase [Caulobacterales bacterium]